MLKVTKVWDRVDGLGEEYKVLSWECDKCKHTGFLAVDKDVEDLTDEYKIHCKE